MPCCTLHCKTRTLWWLCTCPAYLLQAKLEEVLFSIVRSKGFDEAYIDCYRMVTQFYQSRQPLVVIICGAAWTGEAVPG